MSADLLPWGAPDGVEVLIQWLIPLGIEVADERKPDDPLPFCIVHKLPGTTTRLVDSSMYSVHTLDTTKIGANDKADEVHRRILLLSGDFIGQQKVTLSDGNEVWVDNVVCTQTPHWVQWNEHNTIHRFVGTYRLDLRFVQAT